MADIEADVLTYAEPRQLVLTGVSAHLARRHTKALGEFLGVQRTAKAGYLVPDAYWDSWWVICVGFMGEDTPNSEPSWCVLAGTGGEGKLMASTTGCQALEGVRLYG